MTSKGLLGSSSLIVAEFADDVADRVVDADVLRYELLDDSCEVVPKIPTPGGGGPDVVAKDIMPPNPNGVELSKKGLLLHRPPPED